VETKSENDFRLTVEDLEAKVTAKTKALLVNFPCNPTGATLSPSEMEAILDFAAANDLVVLADEVYSELVYDVDASKPLTGFATFREHRDRVVLLNGFSKSWAMTGYRLGYAAGPRDIIDAMMKIHQYGIMSAPTLSQAAGVEAMDRGDADVERMRREYRKRRDYLFEALTSAGLKTFLPKGAFYIFPDIRKSGLSSEEFAMRLLNEHGVACVPGTAFGACGEGFVRMSYATALDKIKIAAGRIAAMVR
jgi:aminotransferase